MTDDQYATALAFWFMLGGYALILAGAALLPRAAVRFVALTGSLIGATAAWFVGIAILSTGQPLVLAAPGFLNAVGGLFITVDRLGAFFLAMIAGIAAPVAVYTFGYVTHDDAASRHRWLTSLSAVFVVSMSLVPCAGNAVTFVLAWELMAVSSFFLVVADDEREAARKAGLWYVAMTHLGLLAILAAFYLVGAADTGATFATARGTAAALPPPIRNAVFLLALLGFGSKAGLVPVHIWLPRAHPEAPSQVSALMSGVMVKLGIYGLLRLCLDILGVGPFWWGATLVTVGAITALTGVLYALVDDDLKKLLAYSTVENVGLIVLGLGAGFVFLSLHQPIPAGVAFSAALLHTVNHAVFKSVLFLAAGSVLHATGLRNMNRMGGLIKTTPWTAAVFLVGAMAIAALPPLNGFVGEWLLFQSFLPGVASSRAPVALLLTMGVGALALTSGLAAATFVKAFGTSFLAIPRSPDAARAQESGLAMRLGMGALAAACPILALATVPLLTTIRGVLTDIVSLRAFSVTFHAGLTIQTPEGIASVSPIVIALILAVVLGGTAVAIRLVATPRRIVGDTWGCGRVGQTPRMEYTASAFAEPLRRVFGELYRPTLDLTISRHGASPYHIRSIRYRVNLHPWFDRALYGPVVRLALGLATLSRSIQNGSVNAYLAYMVLVLVVMLTVVLAF